MTIEVDFKALGLMISKYRHAANLSQEKLAERIDVSTNFLGNIERGEKRPSVETFFKLCVALNISPNDLLNSSVGRLVTDQEKHQLRDSAYGFRHTLSSILLAEKQEAEAAEGIISQFGVLEIPDEYGFTWRN